MTDTWVVSTSQLFWIVILWTLTWVSESLLSILPGIYLKVQLLEHRITLFKFLKIVIGFLMGATPLYIPIGKTLWFQFLHFLANTWYYLIFVCLFCFAFILAILTGVKEDLTVILTSISLIMSNVRHLFLCYLLFVYFPWRNVYSSSLPIFLSWVFCLPLFLWDRNKASNCGAGEDSWESFGQQGDQTRQS